jgi:hypothetical protein
MKYIIFLRQNMQNSSIPGFWVSVPAANHDIPQLSFDIWGHRQLLEIEANVSDDFVYGPAPGPCHLKNQEKGVCKHSKGTCAYVASSE